MLYGGDDEGGSFCGGVRYTLTDVFDAGCCHCPLCRRTSGAPAMAWVNTPRAGCRLLRGTPRFAATSGEFRRAFCTDCGTLMWTERIDPARWDMVAVRHGTIDRAAAIEPAIRLCHTGRLAWFRIDDALPRVEDDALPHPAGRGDPRWRE
jgi:hypothetical protein